MNVSKYAQAAPTHPFTSIYVNLIPNVYIIAIKSREVPMLFFANKMDLAMAMTEQEVANSLKLDQITDRPWHIE